MNTSPKSKSRIAITLCLILVISVSIALSTKAHATSSYRLPSPGEAFVISFQDQQDYWHAIGPVQAVLIGQGKELDGLKYVYHQIKDDPQWVERRIVRSKKTGDKVVVSVFRLGRSLESGETDPRSYFTGFPY